MQERRLIILFFIYLVLEGALRKWVFPSFSTELFLVKDLLMALVFTVYIGKKLLHRTDIPLQLLRAEGLCLSGWVFFTCGSLLVTGFSQTAFIGLSYYLIMLPLVIIIPRILQDSADLERLLKLYLWLAIPVCLLGIIQFSSAPDAEINRYAWTKSQLDVVTLGLKNVRITGTFSYISPYAVYLQFMFLVGLGLLVRAESERSRIFLIFAVFLILMNIVMTGSRAPFIISVLLAFPFLNRLLKLLKKSRGGWSLALTAVLLGGLIYLTGDVFDLLSARNKEAQDSSARISGALLIPLNTLRGINIVGSGVGSTFMGVRETTGGTEEAAFEEVNADRLGIELGAFGYLFVLCFKLLFLVNTWRLYRRATDASIQVWALVVLCTQLTYVWQIPVYNAVAAAFYFGSIGLYIFLRKEQARLDNLMRTAPVAA